jgi:hypothetical protein
VRIFGVIGLLGFCLAVAGPAARAQDGSPANEQTSPRLSVLGDQDAASPTPRILRGSAIPRKAPDPEPVTGPARFSLLAGKRLWLTDPETREVVACALYQTTDVGVRVVRCYRGDLPRSLARN